jgi:hypothetical protein
VVLRKIAEIWGRMQAEVKGAPMRRALVTLAVAALLPTLASATAQASVHPTLRPASHFQAVAKKAEAHWLRTERAHLRKDGGSKLFRIGTSGRLTARRTAHGAGAPAAAGAFLDAGLEPAGHLGGSADADVLDLREVGLTRTTGLMGVSARDGRTGALLWQRSIPVGSTGVGFVQFEPAKLGPTAQHDVMAIEVGEVDNPDGSSTLSVKFEALSGATGAQLWWRTFTGTIAADGTGTTVPGDINTFHDSASGPDDLLVDLNSATETEGTTVADVVSGADGTVKQFGSALSSTDSFPTEDPVPDVNGDGLDDVLVVDPGATGYVSIEDGTTAAPIWQTLLSSSQPDVETVGVYTHAGTPDVAVGSTGPTGNEKFTVLSGLDGHIVWTRSADFLIPIQKAGNDLAPAVELVKFINTDRGRTMAAGLRVTAVGVTDNVIYTKRIVASIKAPPHTISSEGSVGFDTIGDVQPDGALESAVQLQVSASSTKKVVTKNRDGIVDGKTGEFNKFNFQAAADGSLRHGKGTDFLAAKVISGHPEIEAWRGSTRALYYRRTLSTIGGMKHAETGGIRVSGHACSDQALDAQSATRGILGILTATGRPLWTVSFGAKMATGGRVTAHKPKSYCV